MKPIQIAQLITENIKENNGLQDDYIDFEKDAFTNEDQYEEEEEEDLPIPQTMITNIKPGLYAYKTMHEKYKIGDRTIPRFVSVGNDKSTIGNISGSQYVYKFEWPNLQHRSSQPISITSWYGGGDVECLPKDLPAIILNNQYGAEHVPETAELEYGMECIITVPCRIIDIYYPKQDLPGSKILYINQQGKTLIFDQNG